MAKILNLSLKLRSIIKVMEILDYKEEMQLMDYLLKDGQMMVNIISKAISIQKRYLNKIKSNKWSFYKVSHENSISSFDEDHHKDEFFYLIYVLKEDNKSVYLKFRFNYDQDFELLITQNMIKQKKILRDTYIYNCLTRVDPHNNTIVIFKIENKIKCNFYLNNYWALEIFKIYFIKDMFIVCSDILIEDKNKVINNKGIKLIL